MHILINFLFFFLLIHNVYALSEEEYCDRKKLGWHFYCEKEEIAKEENDQNQNVKNDPVAEVKAIQEKLEYLRSEAVLRPTEENMRAYMQFQNQQMEKASFFSDMWRRLIWNSPELDYTLKRPVSTVGKQEWLNNVHKLSSQSMKELNNNYGVFFIYRSDCSYCHAYSPILKRFSDKYGVKVQGITMNGITIEGWENSFKDNGQVKNLGLEGTPTPATILFDKRSKETIPVGFGVLTLSDLEHRIFTLTEIEVGNAY